MLALLLSTFDIEALEMVTHTMELIHKLVKMEQKKQLNLTEQYLLYWYLCLDAASARRQEPRSSR